jgi:urocanate hydratase
MGGAQPLAASLCGATSLNVEVDPHRLERRLETRYLDEVADDLDDAVDRVRRYAADGRGVSIGILGNAADVFAEIAARGIQFDLVTDQTSAHDMLNG